MHAWFNIYQVCVLCFHYARRHPAHPVSVMILHAREVQGLWSQYYGVIPRWGVVALLAQRFLSGWAPRVGNSRLICHFSYISSSVVGVNIFGLEAHSLDILVGLRERTNFFEALFQMRCWAAHVGSSQTFAATLPWDDSTAEIQHRNAVQEVDNTMPWHSIRCYRHNVRTH